MACKITITMDDNWNVGVAVEPPVPIVVALGALETARALMSKPLYAEQAKVVAVPGGALRALPKGDNPSGN